MSVRGSLVCGLDVLDRTAQFLIQVLNGCIEGILIGRPKDHLQTVVGG